ncbi:hypothetical protein THRCLA_06041 [Thraustotheca clavata]|uniref:Uncharacterized protein n=1 Tax=Thraustotheca clavata TaxID=74557 RepID=A0A1V9ZQK7_9STRA|nr:hypothetical protein THRCLA_06041 [Thraustotheca clavata]
MNNQQQAKSTALIVLPELIDVIAQFLPTNNDMYLLLQAIPVKYLSEALSTLQYLMLMQTKQNINNSNMLYFPIQIEDALWPNLPLTNNKISNDGMAALKKIILLYSSITLDPHRDFDLPLNTNAKITYCCIKSLESMTKILLLHDASNLTLSMNDVLKTIKNRHSLSLWHGVAALPKLERLTVKTSYRSIPRLIEFVAIVKSSKTLKHLLLACEYQMGDDNLALYDRNFVENLCAMSKNLTSLVLKNLTIPASFVSKKFNCPEWLISQKPELLKFKHGKLSGIILNTTEVANVIESIAGMDLIEFGINWNGIERCSANSNIKLLEVLGEMPSLRKLKISGFVLDVQCCELLAKILPRLQVCWLFNNQLDNNCGILAQALTQCTRLHRLSLIHQSLSDESATLIANSIATGSTIRSLDLSSNKIGSLGAIALSYVMPQLDSINLSRNEVGYDGAIAIAKIICHLNHTSLTLDSNPLTKDGANAIISQLILCTNRLQAVSMKHILGVLYEKPLIFVHGVVNDFERQLATFPNYRL